MSKNFQRAFATLGLLLCGALVAAQGRAPADLQGDPSGRVGRMALVQGAVSFRAGPQAEQLPASLNWPVTAGSIITTQRDGRAELRVGSAVVQMNGATELEVMQLNDAQFHLRLRYGSLGVQAHNPEVASEMLVRTPQGSVRLSEAGRVRIDAELAPDTTSVTVFAGAAQFDGMGSSLRVRPGKRLDAANDEFRMLQARSDSFDDWSAGRENQALTLANSPSARYVSPETTGYEELDRHGDWRETEEHGPLWAPRSVASDWTPYRDGRWSWVEPWGWTWIDNAAWGYAPSHYGRWVLLDRRWFWSPGRLTARPVWAPALVGWVGGSNWSLSLSGPSVGWFPLAPREIYVPRYRVSARHADYFNSGYRWQYSAGRDRYDGHTYRYARDALTVLPHQHFTRGGTIAVSNRSRVSLTQEEMQRLPRDIDRRFLDGQTRRQDRDSANGVARDGRRDLTGSQVRTSQPEVRGSSGPAVREGGRETWSRGGDFDGNTRSREDAGRRGQPVTAPAQPPVSAPLATTQTLPAALVRGPEEGGPARSNERSAERSGERSTLVAPAIPVLPASLMRGPEEGGPPRSNERGFERRGERPVELRSERDGAAGEGPRERTDQGRAERRQEARRDAAVEARPDPRSDMRAAAVPPRSQISAPAPQVMAPPAAPPNRDAQAQRERVDERRERRSGEREGTPR